MISSSVLGLIAFFALFLLAAWGLRWLQRNMGKLPGRSAGVDIHVLARHSLGWQCILTVVVVAGKTYVITVSRRGGVTFLGETDVPVPAIPNENVGFAEVLRRAISQRGKKP